MRSTQQHQFSRVPSVSIPRAKFDRSHGIKTTLQHAGVLYPMMIDEVLPGDTFSCRTSGFCRMSTPMFPVMDNMFMDTFYFFVPSRLLWNNWQKLMGEQENPGDSTDYLCPIIDTTTITSGFDALSLADCFGLPVGIPNIHVNSMPFRAYNLIWNEWFRDQNMQDSVTVNKGDGPDDIADYNLLRRGKRHDYFTACLPWPQKGAAVELPIGGTASVTGVTGTGTGLVHGIGVEDLQDTYASQPVYDTSGTNTYTYSKAIDFVTGDPAGNVFIKMGSSGGLPQINAAIPSLSVTGTADLSTATAITINALREAIQLQVLLERDARGGTRYTEILRAHFGVVSPDSRLQRPEYLGGGETTINVHPVSATADLQSDALPDSLNTGGLRAFATAAFKGHGFTRSFVEHGFVIGLVSVRADITYQQGLHRMWSRRSKYDFPWPALTGIGEQEVLNKEIYAQGNSDDALVFGYQERYGEYRYKPSQVCNVFRSSFPQTLDSWHLAQDFGSLPELGDEFIQDNPPLDRVLQVTSADSPNFIADLYHNYICVRPLPLYGVPAGLFGRF